MKKQIHPQSNFVVFQDIGSDYAVLTRSTIESKETVKWEDGKTYPMIKVEISSKSHPFYTGKQKIIDTENRVKNFETKIKNASVVATQKKKEKRKKRRTRVQEIKGGERVTLKDMLKDLQ